MPREPLRSSSQILSKYGCLREQWGGTQKDGETGDGHCNSKDGTPGQVERYDTRIMQHLLEKAFQTAVFKTVFFAGENAR